MKNKGSSSGIIKVIGIVLILVLLFFVVKNGLFSSGNNTGEQIVGITGESLVENQIRQAVEGVLTRGILPNPSEQMP